MVFLRNRVLRRSSRLLLPTNTIHRNVTTTRAKDAHVRRPGVQGRVFTARRRPGRKSRRAARAEDTIRVIQYGITRRAVSRSAPTNFGFCFQAGYTCYIYIYRNYTELTVCVYVDRDRSRCYSDYIIVIIIVITKI